MRCGVFAQLRSLVNAEFVLLVDYNQAKILEFYVGLQQRNGSDNNVNRTGSYSVQDFASVLSRQATRYQGPLDVAVLEISFDAQEVLVGQNLGLRHDRHLHPVVDSQQSGVERDDRLTRADVTLQQAIHRLRPGHISGYLSNALVLILREQEWKPFSYSAVDFVSARTLGGRREMLNLVPAKSQTQLHQKQLVKFQSALCLGQLVLVRRGMYPLTDRRIPAQADRPPRAHGRLSS
jgi:hypothetical protein